MAESEKIISTQIKVNTSNAEKEIAKLTKQVEELDKQIEKKRSARSGLYTFVEDLKKQAEQLDKNSEAYKKVASMIDSAQEELFRFEDKVGITPLLDQSEQLQGKIYDIRQNEEEITRQAELAAQNMQKQDDASEQVATKTDEAAQNTQDLNQNANGSAGAFEKVANRITRMIRNIFFFNLISKALREVVNYFAQALAQNQQWVNAVRELRGAFQTLVQPLIGAVLPILVTILQVITAIVSHIASVLALFFGSTLAESANSAKKISAGMGGAAKSAEKMKKSLAGFDQLNVLQDNDTGSGGGGVGGIKGSSFDFAKGIKSRILELEAIALGAMLALGLLLLFFGGPAQWPLALGLIAAGALGLVGLVNSKDITPELKQKIYDVMAIAAMASLALGLLLLFFGGPAIWPKALGLIALGVVGLVTALSSSDITPSLKNKLMEIMAIASVSSLALGLILLLTGASPGLGLALIVAGLTGTVALSQTDWFAQWKKKFQQELDNVAKNFKTFVKNLKNGWAGWRKKFSEEWSNCKENFQEGVKAIQKWWSDWVAKLKQEWANVIENLKSAWNGFKTFFHNAIVTIANFLLNLIMPPIKLIIAAFLSVETGVRIVIDVVKALGTSIGTVAKAAYQAFTGDFKGAQETLKSGFQDAKNQLAAIGTESDKLKGQLNNVFGKKYSLTIETNEIRNIATNITQAYAPGGKYKVMQMATGGVIPPNREFLTMLGDNKTEPEVVSPISTMQQAFTQALEQSGYSGGQTIQVNVDGRKLFEVMVNQNNSAVRRTGMSPLKI